MNQKGPRKARNKDRAPDQTTMTVSLPNSLKAKIEEAAAADKRSMSNWMVKRVEEWLDEMARQATPAPLSGHKGPDSNEK